MRALLSVLLSLVAVAGCQPNREAQVVGRWRQQGASVPGMPPVSLELRQDKTYVFNAIVAFEGKWHLDGSAVALESGRAMGMDVPQTAEVKRDWPLRLSVSTDGKQLVSVDQANPQSVLTLVREQ